MVNRALLQKIFTASAATAAGVGVCVAAAKQCETGPCPRFSIEGSRFDNSTFSGRFKSFLVNNDPSNLLATSKMIREAEAKLEAFKQGDTSMPDAELWAARKLCGSAVHPDTGDIVPQPFRMSGYVPYNGPVCVAMIVSQSTPLLLFFNWMNQSQNALINYFNRNATSEMSNETLAKSYCGAVGSALCVVFGLSQFIQRRYDPRKAQSLLKFVAFPASLVASSLNCYIVRRNEIPVGITLSDKDGNVVADGKRSSLAAKRAVMETVQSRALLQIPVFLIPAMVMSVPGFAALPPMVSLAASTLTAIVAFGLGLPATLASFPQIGEIETSDLEPEFEGLGGGKLYYNKGL